MGVTTIEDLGVEFLFHRKRDVADTLYVILPDTIQSIGHSDRYTMCRFIYSDHNTAINLYKLYPESGGANYNVSKEAISTLGKTSLYDFYGIVPNSFKTFGFKTYYFDANRQMATGTVTINGKICTFGEDGILQSEKEATVLNGLICQDGKAYYYENGLLQKSKWVYADGYWYYLNDYGAGVVNCWRLNGGKYYYLGSDGKMKTNSWIKDYGNWYYVKADGSRYESSWAKIGGTWYWFGGSGKMAENQWLKLADGKWYYFTTSGAMAANRWVKSGSYWYYLGKDGAMLTNTTTPDGYKVDAAGRWI